MRILVKVALAAAVAGSFAFDAWAQSQGPLTTVPWASRSRTKPNPDNQTIQSPQEPAKEADALLIAPPSNAAKARQALIVRTARENNMTLRQIARHTAAGTGHRVLVGDVKYMADEMEAWLKEEACDGFNVVCNHYPKPFEDFCEQVVPELQRRGLFRREYEGTTLRDSLGLKKPKSRYAKA